MLGLAIDVSRSVPKCNRSLTRSICISLEKMESCTIGRLAFVYRRCHSGFSVRRVVFLTRLSRWNLFMPKPHTWLVCRGSSCKTPTWITRIRRDLSSIGSNFIGLLHPCLQMSENTGKGKNAHQRCKKARFVLLFPSHQPLSLSLDSFGYYLSIHYSWIIAAVFGLRE